MTPFPAPNRLHVWWARRPLVASRAAVLTSLLPEDADRKRFLHLLGIHGDPVNARRAIDEALRTGVRVEDPYGYDRAFKYCPDRRDANWLKSNVGNGVWTQRRRSSCLRGTPSGRRSSPTTRRCGWPALARAVGINPDREVTCCRARGTDRNWTRVDRKMLWSPAASSSQQRARVLTDVKARRFAPPPLRGADGLDAGSAHARPDWLLPTMLTHTPPTCCGRRPVQNDALSGDR